MTASARTAPAFTVVITTFNRPETLQRAVQSVLAQTCEDFELMVIDNGSTDHTTDIMRRYHDPRLRFVVNPEPTLSCDVPRNLGLQMATGRYVAFLDDDDLWYPDKLQRVLQAFEEHPEADAVCHNEYRRTGEQIDGTLRHGPWSDRLFERLLYERNCLSSCATTITRELLQALDGFVIQPSYDGVADYDLWLRMTARGCTIHFIDEPLGEFCMLGTNWHVADTGTASRLANIVRDHLVRYEQRPVYRLSRRGMWRLLEMYYLAYQQLCRARQYAAACRYAWRVCVLLVCKPVLFLDAIRAKRGQRPAGAIA